MREVSARLEQGEDREAKLLWRTRRDEIDDALTALAPGDRGRSLVWFTDLEGELDDRYILQVPVRESLVAFGDQPVIAPLIEVLDHSRPVGVVLASGERVRLLHWAHGTIDEAGEEVFDLEGGGWRPYRGPSSSTPGRGGRSGTTHVEQVEARMEEHRDRFFAEAAQATAQRLDELGWDRVVVAAERPLAAVGPAAVLAALAQRQVDHLVLDPYHRPEPSPLPDVAAAVLGDAGPDRLPERAVEAAIAADARVTTLEAGASPALQQADGMLAGLRW